MYDLYDHKVYVYVYIYIYTHKLNIWILLYVL